MFLKSTVTPKGTLSHQKRVMRCCSSKKTVDLQTKFNAFIDKKKEIDRTRWEKIKEISRTIDHIAKNDIKQTYDLLKSIPQSDDKKEPELKSVDLAEEETS